MRERKKIGKEERCEGKETNLEMPQGKIKNDRNEKAKQKE